MCTLDTPSNKEFFFLKANTTLSVFVWLTYSKKKKISRRKILKTIFFSSFKMSKLGLILVVCVIGSVLIEEISGTKFNRDCDGIECHGFCCETGQLCCYDGMSGTYFCDKKCEIRFVNFSRNSTWNLDSSSFQLLSIKYLFQYLLSFCFLRKCNNNNSKLT